jgi:hypothetical protein
MQLDFLDFIPNAHPRHKHPCPAHITTIAISIFILNDNMQDMGVARITSLVTKLPMEQERNHGSIPSMGKRFSIPALRPTQFPLEHVTGAFPWVLRQLGHDVGHSAQSTTKIRMSGVVRHFPFMIWTDIFTFMQGTGKIICMYIRISTAAKIL